MRRYSFCTFLLCMWALAACAGERKSTKPENIFCQQKEEFIKVAQTKLDELDRRLEALLEHSAATAKPQLEEQLVELVQAKNAAGRKLEYLQSASAKAWPILKADLEEAIIALERPLSRLNEQRHLTQAQ